MNPPENQRYLNQEQERYSSDQQSQQKRIWFGRRKQEPATAAPLVTPIPLAGGVERAPAPRSLSLANAAATADDLPEVQKTSMTTIPLRTSDGKPMSPSELRMADQQRLPRWAFITVLLLVVFALVAVVSSTAMLMNHGPGNAKHAPGVPIGSTNAQTTPTPALSISVETPTGHGHTPTPQATTTATTSPTAAPAPSWKAAFQEGAPNCNDPGGTSWAHIQSGGGNVISCSGSALVMQMGQTHYPETDLATISGGYDANVVQVKVHAHFDNVNSSTYAGTDASIDVQAPLNTSACGGFIFEIRPNGNWRVQQTHSDCTMPVITNGWVGAAADYDMMVRVQNGQFLGFINGAQVVSLGDSISGQVVGLMVIDWAWPTAKISYSNFEVDQWR